MTDEVQQKQIRRLTILKGLLYLICGLTVLSIMITLVIVVSVSISNAKSTKILVDCTTPHHGCYEQGRSATSGAVGTILKNEEQTVVATVYCSGKLGPSTTIAQLQTCVDGLVK